MTTEATKVLLDWASQQPKYKQRKLIDYISQKLMNDLTALEMETLIADFEKELA